MLSAVQVITYDWTIPFASLTRASQMNVILVDDTLIAWKLFGATLGAAYVKNKAVTTIVHWIDLFIHTCLVSGKVHNICTGVSY